MANAFKVLVLYYSQSGKTKAVLETFLEPLKKNPQVEITMEEIRPKVAFPLPWPKLYFFSIFPECVYEIPIEIENPKFDENTKYDLIILGHQVWYLAPSLPITSLLQHAKAKVFGNTPVVSVLFCRKMWRQTHGRLERRLAALQSWVVDKVIVTASGSQMKTLRATKDNLFEKTKTEAEWKPAPQDLEILAKQGMELSQNLQKLQENPHAPIFTVESRAVADKLFSFPEYKAKQGFFAWGKRMIANSAPASKARLRWTFLFCVQFAMKLFIVLPLHPLMHKLRKAVGKDDSEMEILEIPPLEKIATGKLPSTP